MSADSRAFIDELHAIRLASNIPQRAVATRMGVVRSAISRLENDPGRDPHLSTILRYADALGVTIGITCVTPKNGVEQVKSTPCTEAQQ